MSTELRLLWQELLTRAQGYAREAVRPFTVGGKLDRGTPNAVGRTPVAGGGTGHGQGAEPPLGNPAANGQVLASTAAGVRSWVPPGLTTEQVEDAVATLLVAGPGITLTYSDPTGTLTIAATGTAIETFGLAYTNTGEVALRNDGTIVTKRY